MIWIRLGMLVVVFLSRLATGSPAALAQPAGDPVSGVVQEVAETRILLTTGANFTLGDQARVTLVAAATAAQLAPGQYVAITAQLDADGVLQASIVSAFPEELRGTGEGQRPMDGGNLMTNATIEDAVDDTVDSAELTVSFLGQTARVRISGDTRVEIRRLGSPADIVPGVAVTTVVNNGVSGNVSVR